MGKKIDRRNGGKVTTTPTPYYGARLGDEEVRMQIRHRACCRPLKGPPGSRVVDGGGRCFVVLVVPGCVY